MSTTDAPINDRCTCGEQIRGNYEPGVRPLGRAVGGWMHNFDGLPCFSVSGGGGGAGRSPDYIVHTGVGSGGAGAWTAPPKKETANLGLATTEELFRELIARAKTNLFGNVGDARAVDRAVALAEMLGGLSASDREYRTVDADEPTR